MAKQDKSSRSGFVIKLSTETAQKLADEEQQAKNKVEEVTVAANEVIEEGKTDKNVEQKLHLKPSEANQEPHIRDKLATDTIGNTSSDSNQLESSSTDSNETAKTEKSAATNSDSWGEYAPYITYEGEEAIYTDPTSKQKYNWNKETNSWDAKESDTSRVYSYENDTHVYTESDGSKFFWDEDKKAWIPKVDDDFLALYQMSYGFVDNQAQEKKDESKPKEATKKADNPAGVKRKNEPQWFEPSEDKNTKVYVSNLPLDLTEEEFVDFMQKCGLVERDPSTQKMRVKLYKDKEQDCFKGDALCTYIKIESVDLALKLLDGSDLKGNKVKVEKAHFELKGEYNPALKPKKKRKKELEKIKKMQQKLFDWRPEKFIGERSKHERVVIVKNLFHPSDFDKEVQLILDYQQDLREECSKSGEVRKVVLFDRHPEGVAQITMKEPEQADAVVELINGRWFGKRQITAEIWDGRTKYRIAETDADINKRMDKWEKFLEGKDDVNKGSDKPIEDSTAKSKEVEVPDTNKTANEIPTIIVTDTDLSNDTNEDSTSEVVEASSKGISDKAD